MKENTFKIINNTIEFAYTVVILVICLASISIIQYIVYTNSNGQDLTAFFNTTNILNWLLIFLSISKIIVLSYKIVKGD